MSSFIKSVGLMLCCSSMLQAQDNVLIDKVAGVVGDKIVLKSDIDIQTQQAKLQGIPLEGGECQVLDQLLLEKLLINQASIDSIQVSEEEVEIELDNRLRYYIGMLGSEEQFEAYYKKSIPEIKEEFRSEIKDMMLAQRMQSDIVGDVKVTPAEVKTFFNEIPKDSLPYFNAEVQIAEIVINPMVTEKAKTDARSKLQQLRQRIVEGSNTMDELAKTYSEDPGSAPNGGRLGLQDRGTFVKEFEAAAFKLNKGEISSVIETEYGFHILKLLERRGNKIDVQHILVKPEVSFNDLELAKGKADSIRNLILNDSLSFKDAVQEFSEDENSQTLNGMLVNQGNGTSYFELDQLEPDVFFAVEGLKEGEISNPTVLKALDGSKIYKLFHVMSRSEPHQANLEDDYERIKNIAQQKKQAESISTWISDKSTKTFIKLSDEYKECESMLKWLNQ